MMNKTLLNAVFCAILILTTGLFSSCKDYDEDIAGLDNRVKELEAKTKALQNQLEDAIANGCWIEYYDIDQATGNCTLHFLGKSETLTIPSIEGKDATIRHFKVVNNTWQYALNDGVYSDVRNSANNNPIKVTVDEEGKQMLGNINIQTVETEDAGTAQVIYIGDVQTTIKCDVNDPILAIDEENKYMVVSVGSVHYMLLLEGSSFKGLQSVSHRKASAFDDYVEAMTLVDERGAVIIASPAVVSFRVLPVDFKLEQAKFSCEDIRQLKTRAVSPSLSYIKNSATLKSGILNLALEPKNMEENVYFGAVLNVNLNGCKTTSDDFVVKKSTRVITEAKAYRMDNGEREEITETIVFDDKKPLYLNSIDCGFEVGRNKTLESLQELGFDVTLDYKLSDDCAENFTIGKDENGDYLAVKALAPAKDGTVTIVYTMNDEKKTVLLTKNVKVEAKSIDILLGAADAEVNLSAISSLYTKANYISLSTQPLTEAGIEDVNTLFGGGETLKVGYVKKGSLTVTQLPVEKVAVKKANATGESGLYLYIDKQTDLDALTGSENNKTFDLYLLAENGATIQVGSEEDSKLICIKKVNFFYDLCFKVREGMDKEYVIFDNGAPNNDNVDITKFPETCYIKGKAIIGRGDNYSFEDIKFSDLYEWSPEDYVTFSISKDDQTDYLKSMWGANPGFEYIPNEGFSVHTPCILRKLNFGNNQTAEKYPDGHAKKGETIPNTDSEMKAKGGNEGLKISYKTADGKEGKDNWYFLDPISVPGDQLMRYQYRFNKDGRNKYTGDKTAGTVIDLLDWFDIKAFTEQLCLDWYFFYDETAKNPTKLAYYFDATQKKFAATEWGKRYGDYCLVSLDKIEQNGDYITWTAGSEPENFKVTLTKDMNKDIVFRFKWQTNISEQYIIFSLRN